MSGWDNTALFSDEDPADAAFRKEVRTWMESNCPPELRGKASRVTPPEVQPWHRKLYERGWIAPHWPKEYGGMGATLTQQIILVEEMSRLGAPTPFPHGLSFIAPILIKVGTPEQKAKHLPGILSGDTIWCQGYSEQGAGSDLASLKTRATLEGDHFVVNGHKMWTTNGHYADWMFMLVRTDPEAKPRHAGITMLLVDMKSPGITVRPIKTIRGDAEFAEEFFDNVRVPKENMLGELNGGWRISTMVLGGERFATSHPRNAALLLNRAREMSRISGASKDPAFLQQLALLETDLLAYTAYYRHGAALQGIGKAPESMSSVIKIAAGELSQRASELLVQAAGPMGPRTADIETGGEPLNPAEDMFEMRRVSVGGGALEIQRNILAKRALDLPS
jgi:alkylation response protein AidB-like acyl-CoA dehydrogenase